MKKVALHTLGCKLNFAETSTIGRQFVDRGFTVVDVSQPAEVYVLNTCSVTERADKECRQIVRRILRHSPDAYVIVMGCYAQLRPEELARIGGVDLILGSKDKFHLFDHVDNFVKKPVPAVYISCIDEESDADSAYSADVGGRTRAFLKIQDGCDYSCSFCTIPLARGASRSVSPAEVVKQASDLAAQGYKEIVLTGVNVGDYGRKIGTSLLDLMRRLDRVQGIKRIRISSIEPNLLSTEMIEYILSSDRYCPHFHIPLQSGSDAVLGKMQRRYRRGLYENLIQNIRDRSDDAAIGVDVITGFRGETEAEFRETYTFLNALPVSYLHVFTYSERPDTPAMNIADPVEPRIRFERSEMLRNLGRKKKYEFTSGFIGKMLPVLYENDERIGMIGGLSPNYIRVTAEASSPRTNEIISTKIVGLDRDGCIGEITGTGIL